ncbi:hypothetical protein C1645_814614 [Glomus cerebriforme]|uniref:BTB/POZ domain-containing protein n=1 Tax=Glomus cerebriforme TaxID=658196 RepID=A0A397THW3_9GLOM|nr:hypothetical protein C1645_814614 [Glomus cerebriforme]
MMTENPVDLQTALLRDCKNLYKRLESEDDDDCNVILKVGQDNFKAHSVILKMRSEYFRNIISSKERITTIIFNKKINLDIQNIYPSVFTVCLKYIYTGEFSLEGQSDEFIFYLFVAADDLSLIDMVDYLQNYLIDYKSAWIEKNLIEVYQTSLKHPNFTTLQIYCETIIERNPEKIFYSQNFPKLEKTIFLDLIKRDDLSLLEVDIWCHLIKWGLGQDPPMTPLNREVRNWSPSDIIEFEKRIRDFTPHIRFFTIPSDKYHSCVRPYKDVLPQKKIEQLEEYYFVKGTSPPPDALKPRNLKRNGSRYFGHKKSFSQFQQNNGGKQPPAESIPDPRLQRKPTVLATPPKVPQSPKTSNENESQSSRNATLRCESILINVMQLRRISHWIDGFEPSNNFVAKNNNNNFILLARGSWESITKERFHSLCDNKGPTLIIAKVKKTNDIIGGFNPHSWSSSNKWLTTTDSFIFSFKSDGNREGGIDDIILSRIKDSQKHAAIYDGDCNYDVGFSLDLLFFSGEYKCKNYQKKIMDDDNFKIKDYEIFRVERKE